MGVFTPSLCLLYCILYFPTNTFKVLKNIHLEKTQKTKFGTKFHVLLVRVFCRSVLCFAGVSKILTQESRKSLALLIWRHDFIVDRSYNTMERSVNYQNLIVGQIFANVFSTEAGKSYF